MASSTSQPRLLKLRKLPSPGLLCLDQGGAQSALSKLSPRRKGVLHYSRTVACSLSSCMLSFLPLPSSNAAARVCTTGTSTLLCPWLADMSKIIPGYAEI